MTPKDMQIRIGNIHAPGATIVIVGCNVGDSEYAAAPDKRSSPQQRQNRKKHRWPPRVQMWDQGL